MVVLHVDVIEPVESGDVHLIFPKGMPEEHRDLVRSIVCGDVASPASEDEGGSE